jgi:hypothetical protein
MSSVSATLDPSSPQAQPDEEIGGLNWFRPAAFEVFTSRAKTLFSVMDTVSTTRAWCGCPAHGSLSMPVGHAASYRALREGAVDAQALCGLTTQVGDRLTLPRIYAVDTTVIPRPHAPTSRDRQLHHGHGHNKYSHRALCGWQYQYVTRLTGTEDSWALPVSIARVESAADKLVQAVDQIEQICSVDGASAANPSLFVFDAGYQASRLTWEIRQRRLPAEVLVRLSVGAVLYTRPEIKAKSPLGGRPSKHGLGLHLKTLDLPIETSISGLIGRFGVVQVAAYENMHQKIARTTAGFAQVKELPVVEGTVLVANVAHLRPSKQRGRMCLFYSGTRSDLFGLLFEYLRRFDIEHLFRYLKTNAGIGGFHPVEPTTYTTWLRVHALAYAQLFLARDHIDHVRLPWEKRVPRVLTPQMVARQVSTLLHRSWYPTEHAKPTHKPPGWPIGKKRARRERFKLIRMKPKPTKQAEKMKT